MASSILEAFVRLFADDSELKKTFGALPGAALKAGQDVGQSFTAGVGRGVTPARATGAVPLQLQRVGGQEVNAAGSPFSAGFQQFKTARELADIQKTGDAAFSSTGNAARKAAKDVEQYDLSARDAAGTARALGVNLVSELNPALGAGAGIALDVARNLRELGIGLASAGAAAAVAATVLLAYIVRAKEANEVTLELNKAVENKNLAGLEGQVRKSSDALSEFNTNTRIANSQEGVYGFKAGLQSVVAFWANQFGPGAEKITEDMARQRAEFAKLFKELQAPKDALQSIIDFQELLQGQLGLDKDLATSSTAVRHQSDLLVESMRVRTRAAADLILEEKKLVENDRARLGDDVTNARLARIDERANNLLEKGAQEREKIRRTDERAAVEFNAKQIESDNKVVALRRQNTTSLIALAQQIVDSEASANISLEQVFKARGDLQRAATQSQLAGLKEESDARRAALQERIQGAQGSERADLERELTQVTQEEAAKRTEIITQSISQSIQLAQKERQERLGQADQVFSIQRSLNQRRLQDDIDTQAAIARSAQAGSKIQIDALQKVAEMSRQLQDQGRSAITQGINILQQQAQRMGLDGPAFVSLTSINEGIERQRQRDDLTRRQLQAGESVRTEDAQALASNPLEIFKQFGNDIGNAATAAFTPIADQFKSIVGSGITTELETLTSKVTNSFVSLTTEAGPALSSLEKLFSETFDRMKAKAESGTSELAISITKMVSENLARSFVDAEKRF